jgi:L,D-transpeptidase ErfK/SrfK
MTHVRREDDFRRSGNDKCPDTFVWTRLDEQFVRSTIQKNGFMRRYKSLFILVGGMFFLFFCRENKRSGNQPGLLSAPANTRTDTLPAPLFTIVSENISVKSYFKFLQKIVASHDTLVPYPLNEHLLVRANPWIIDTLQHTDYYRRKLLGDTVWVQPEEIVLHRGDTLFFPDSLTALTLQDRLNHTSIDVNIPEFRLRILEYGKEVYSFPVRVGQNRIRFLAEAGHSVDLRTKTGDGSVIRINRYPVFVNPVDGKKFTHTRRDDGVTTLMPQIPWTEVELDGMRYGQMIHPTTNPNTLGKAYSNGCIGLGEADAWRFYYSAPLGTHVVFRYDLQVINETGDTITLPDIYKRGKKKQPVRAVIGVFP